MSPRLHLAVVIEYDRGAVLADDVEAVLEEGLALRFGSGERTGEPERVVKATAVIVSEGLHDKLRDVGEGP